MGQRKRAFTLLFTFCCFNFRLLKASFTFLFLHSTYVPTFISAKVFKGSIFLHKLKEKILTKQIAYKDRSEVDRANRHTGFFFFF